MPPDDPEHEKGKAKEAFNRPQGDPEKPKAPEDFRPYLKPDDPMRAAGDAIARQQQAQEALRQQGGRLPLPPQVGDSKAQQIAVVKEAAAKEHAVQREAQTRTHERERQDKQRDLFVKYDMKLAGFTTERQAIEDRMTKARAEGGRIDNDQQLLAVIAIAAADTQKRRDDEWRGSLVAQADERDRLNEQLQAELDAQLQQIEAEHERGDDGRSATEPEITAWVKTMQAETIERQQQETEQLDQLQQAARDEKDQELSDRYGPDIERLQDEQQASEARQAAKGLKAVFNRKGGRAGQDAQRAQQIGFELKRIATARRDELARFAERQESARQDLAQQHETELQTQEQVIEQAYITGRIPGRDRSTEQERDHRRDERG